MPSSRPRGSCGSHGSQRTTVTPMSERQQMALLMQMISQTNEPSSAAPSGHTRSKDRNERGETSLHVAAIKGDQEQVKKLLDQGADPNAADFAGWTPLHEACSRGWYKIVVSLVEAGANVNARGLDDETPLHDAARNVHLKLVKFLIEHGADPSFKNKKGYSPSDVAAASVSNYLNSLDKDTSGQKSSHSGRGKDNNCKKASSNQDSTLSGEGTGNASGMDPLKVNEDGPEKDNKNNLSADKVGASDGKDADTKTHTGGSVSSFNQEDNAVAVKRPISDLNEISESEISNEEDALRKKKRKESDVKDTPTKSSQFRGNVGRTILAGTKPPGPASKTGVAPLSKGGGSLQSISSGKQSTSALTGKGVVSNQGSSGKGGNSSATSSGKAGALIGQSQKASGGGVGKGLGSSGMSSNLNKVGDRKSPSASPKHSTFTQAKDSSDQDNDENKTQESSGPKVPPLKIVIPGGVGGANTNNNQQEGEGGSSQRTGGKGRSNSSTLPYVIAFNMSAPGEANTNTGDNDNLPDGSKDDKRQSASDDKGSGSGQRVLRSHRVTDGNEKEKEKERTSPQSVNPASPNAHFNPLPAKTPPLSASHQSADGDCLPSTSSGYSGHASSSTINHIDKCSGLSGNATPGTSSQSNVAVAGPSTAPVELHPRKRKIKASKESHSHSHSHSHSASTSDAKDNCANEIFFAPFNSHPNPYHMYFNIRKQVERRQKNLFPVQPKPPQGFKDYLINRRTYVLQSNVKPEPAINSPATMPIQMREDFVNQERERHKLRVQHLVEKEKLVLAVEQEILRVHGRAARALANQSLPFSVCTLLRDKEVYTLLTPDQEEKERNAQRSRYNGRLFLSWLQDVDDKWEKIKEEMVRRHHLEAESMHAIQTMDWEWRLKELGLCDNKSTPKIDQTHVPKVHVSDDFDLIPA